uniref:MAX dimerization protein MLX n=1 Tax=Junco hyemalis TaxID=40217 RepID=A0A8C5J0C3_JUNHY
MGHSRCPVGNSRCPVWVAPGVSLLVPGGTLPVPRGSLPVPDGSLPVPGPSLRLGHPRCPVWDSRWVTAMTSRAPPGGGRAPRWSHDRAGGRWRSRRAPPPPRTRGGSALHGECPERQHSVPGQQHRLHQCLFCPQHRRRGQRLHPGVPQGDLQGPAAPGAHPGRAETPGCHQAIDYIQFLHKEKKKQEEEVSTLRKDVMALKIMKVNYEQIVKAHQNNPNEGKNQISDEVKFNVFQGIMDSLFQSFNASVSVTSFQELSACVFSWIEEHCKPQTLRDIVIGVLHKVKSQLY